MTEGASTCPSCGAPRQATAECPRCGIVYAKADARAAKLADLLPVYRPEAPEPSPLDAPDEGRRELWRRRLAAPAALLVLVGLVHTGAGHALVRIFLSMWIHELGHAVSAWLCGVPSVPGPWATHSWDERSPFLIIVLLAAYAFLIVRSWRNDRRWLWILAPALVLQCVCTFALPLGTVRTWITFWGDGGCMLIGAVLMATFAVGPEHPLRTHQVRWGLLVIGAAALADAGSLWFAARTNLDAIPFGVQEGVGLSDPSRLTEWAGWSVTTLVHRYLLVLGVSLAVVSISYARGLWRARADAD